jgi:hypothetical protein
MRRLGALFPIVIVLGALALPNAGQAQQGRGGYPGSVEGANDPLRPYASNSSAPGRGYYRVPPPRSEPVARPVVRSQGVRDYYPTMRTGQGPNRNVVNPRSLCVPGRRAILIMPQQSTLPVSPLGGIVTGSMPSR